MKSMRNQRVGQICFGFFVLAALALPAFAEDFVSKFNDWRVSGPSGGDVRAIVVDPRDKDHLFVTTLDGQIYDSLDAGANWRLLVNLKRPQLILDNFVVDARDSNLLYASGHRHKLPGGFFKSADGGRTWKEAPELRREAVHAMVQSSKDPNLILVGTVTGIWVSRDSGDTWSKFSSPSTPIKLDALAIDPRDADTIYAGTWWRAFKSKDGGKNWKLVKKGMIDDSDVFAIDINPQNPDHVIASACSGIYQSFNQGESWKKIQGIPSQSRRTRAILQNPSKPGYVYAGTTEGFWMSANKGVSWSLTTSRKLEINSIAVHPDAPNRVFIGTNNNGVMVSNDAGRTFAFNNGNFSSRFTYNVVHDIERPNRLYATTINTATGGGFFFVSDDFGRNWRSSTKNLDVKRIQANSLLQDRTNPNLIYLGTNTGLFKSINRGVSWTPIKAPRVRRTYRRSRKSRRRYRAPALPKGVVAALTGKVSVLKHTEDGKNGYLAGTSRGLYRTYDATKNWKKLNLGPGISENILAIHVSPKAPGTIWVGTSISGVLVSYDDGVTWKRTGMIPQRVPVSSIATNPDKPNEVYVGTIQTFYMSKDGGATWRRRGGGLPLGNYNSILINPKNTDEIFVASAKRANGGIYHSTNAGLTWERIDRGVNLASSRVWKLMFNPTNENELLAATHSSGIYRIGRTQEAKAKPVEAEKKIKVVTNETITRSRVAGSN